MSKPSILCVDDEVNILEGLQDNLRKRFKVHTALSGAEGLEIIEAKGPFPVVISDMRMPGMNGAEFLSKVRDESPNTMRILLTGQSDIESAISAVNEGQIFRFLTKPCPTDHLMSVIDLAVEHNRLFSLEKDLLENTLQGCVEALVEVLQLTNPVAFSRTNRLKEYVSHMANELNLADRWQYEVAALLSQVGFVSLPAETLKKMFAGQPLDEDEIALVNDHPTVAFRLISKIPRLENVAGMILHQEHFSASDSGTEQTVSNIDLQDPTIKVGSQMLYAASEYDAQRSLGSAHKKAIQSLQKSLDPELDAILESLTSLPVVENSDSSVYKMANVEDLCQGMILDQEITDTNGILLMASGQIVTETVMHRLNAFAQREALDQPFRVRVAA